MEYYHFVLSELQKTIPDFPFEIAYCKECGIAFLTSRTNKGRDNLCCPFGCRLAVKKRKSNQRCRLYYRTHFGKLKKKRLNQRRYPKKHTVNEEPDSAEMDITILYYLRLIIFLLEKKRMTRDRLLWLLKNRQRQHRLGKTQKIRKTIQDGGINTS